MDQKQVHDLLVSDYKAYLEIVSERGIPFSGPATDSEIEKLSDSDLKVHVRHLRDIARTPGG